MSDRKIKWLVRHAQYRMRDILSRLKYGQHFAPKSFETIWINPLNVRLQSAPFRRRYSGRVIDGDWDIKNISLVENHPKIKACKRHFINGESWQDCGMFDLMLQKINQFGCFDNCSNRQDLQRRYEQLDLLYSTLQSGGEFKTMKQVNPNNFREHGGIHIHIG